MADLKDILKTSSKAEGSIKCTYAEIFDEQMHKVFSLQRKSFSQQKSVAKGQRAIVQTGRNTYDVVSGIGALNDLTFDLEAPIVRLVGTPSDTSRYVSVKLLDDAKQYILDKILVPKPYFEVWAEYDVYTNGDWQRPEKRRVRLYRGRTLPPDSVKKTWYDGKMYDAKVYSLNLDITKLNSVADQIKDFDGMTESMCLNDLFRHSLWLFGIMVMANALKPVNTYPAYFVKFPSYPLFGEDVRAFVNKYQVSQEDALEYLITHPSFALYADALKEFMPEVYLNIRISEPTQVAGYADGYEEIAEAIKSGQTFKVLSSAIDWYGTDIKNATVIGEDGQTVYDLDDYIALYKKKMDNAKAILLAAGAAAALI